MKKNIAKNLTLILLLTIILVFTSCTSCSKTNTGEQPAALIEQVGQPQSESAPQPLPEEADDEGSFSTDTARWAGIRISSYGMKRSFGEDNFPDPASMASFADKMSSLYEGSTGAHILIVGTVSEKDWSCRLSFPLSHDIERVSGRDEDFYESYLDAFDRAGHEVWLQVEPGDADLVELAVEVMNRYKHHSSVKGFGIDVEWYRPEGTDGYGTVLDEDTALAVLEAVQDVDPTYTVFVKHWDCSYLPEDIDGLIYVNDSQGFHADADATALERLADTFAGWAFLFDPCPVMFQIGYNADRSIWGVMDNPARDLGQAILDACFTDNDKGVIWVDFTLDEAMRRI